MKSLLIYTDGSCLGNPGPGGWAAIIRDGSDEVVLSGSETHTTNNRMEMMAIIRALQWMKAQYGNARAARLFSDSNLIIQTLTKGWKRKNNVDLWQELEAARDGLTLDWNWVKGHANDPLNERCDQLAVAEAEKAGRLARKSPSMVATKTSVSESSHGEYRCPHCGRASEGLLGYLPEADMIRVDCPHCGKYLKFASPTPQNLKRAKERPLMTAAEIEALQKKKIEAGEPLTERQLKELKKMTRAEARATFESNQKLF